jgi:hypothetical protein
MRLPLDTLCIFADAVSLAQAKMCMLEHDRPLCASVSKC